MRIFTYLFLLPYISLGFGHAGSIPAVRTTTGFPAVVVRREGSGQTAGLLALSGKKDSSHEQQAVRRSQAETAP